MAKKNEGPSKMKEVQAVATIDDKEVLNNKAEEKEKDRQKKLPKDEKETKTTTTSYEDLLNISEDWIAYESLLYKYFKGEFSVLLLWWLLENAVDAVNVAHKRRRRSYFPSSAFGSTCPKCSILAQLIFLKSSHVHAFYSYSILHSLRIWPRRCFRPDLLRRWKGPSKAGGVCLIVVEECGDDEVKVIVSLFKNSRFISGIMLL
ncbi:putative S-adenosyl-L-methionine-dependent methyltransferase [Senna tora]|uniref:Putative S-adenosyl-L-methionine-dependent methyltransferase n=1 Tax=Senna tora TaxID=362788 RepID=A0A834T5Y0_9FABA|nr:putative S-adenosyl-L-methionine-dependent methyltransferase [Senna tora]